MKKLLFAFLGLLLVSDLALASIPKGGSRLVPFERYGEASSTTTGAAALEFSVPGLPAGAVCVVSTTAFGTGPAEQHGPVVVTQDKITVTYDASQTDGTTKIAYLCFKP